MRLTNWDKRGVHIALFPSFALNTHNFYILRHCIDIAFILLLVKGFKKMAKLSRFILKTFLE